MGMQINETRRHGQAIGIDFALSGSGYLADRGNRVAVYGNVGLAWCVTGTVDN
jgi:hypothetical protein